MTNLIQPFNPSPAGIDGPPTRRYMELVAILETSLKQARTGQLSLGQIFARLENSSFSFVCILLSLPFLQPISLGPLSTIGGLNFAALGWQMVRGHAAPWLPDKLKTITPSERLWRAMLKVCLFIIKLCGRFTRPRLQSWVIGPVGNRLCGALIIIAGLLMAIPLAGVPLNNAIPALVILFVAMSQLEEDGLMLLVALFWLAVALLYFTLLGYVFVFSGEQALNWLNYFFP